MRNGVIFFLIIKRDFVQLGEFVFQFMLVKADFLGENQKRRFHRVPGYFIRASFFQDREMGVGAKSGDFSGGNQFRMADRIYRSVFVNDFAFGDVSGPGNFESFSAGEKFFDHHFVFSDGAGFVYGDYSGLPERFHRLQFFNQPVAARHTKHPANQNNRHHDRQSFRNDGNGQRNRHLEHFNRRFAGDNASGEEQADYYGDRSDDQA